jgi:hypothetical protein
MVQYFNMPSKKRAGKKEATVDSALQALEQTKITARTATGEWATTPKSRDIQISNIRHLDKLHICI